MLDTASGLSSGTPDDSGLSIEYWSALMISYVEL
jgi:hypothetical protein